jgi:hypothetical protein
MLAMTWRQCRPHVLIVIVLSLVGTHSLAACDHSAETDDAGVVGEGEGEGDGASEGEGTDDAGPEPDGPCEAPEIAEQAAELIGLIQAQCGFVPAGTGCPVAKPARGDACGDFEALLCDDPDGWQSFVNYCPIEDL